MFFETDHLEFELIAVLNLSWDQKNEKSGIREHHAISYRFKGSSLFIHDDETMTVSKGEIAFVPAYYTYTQIASSEKLIVVHFHSDDALPGKIIKFKPENSNYFEKLFLDLYTAWTKKQPGYLYECKSILYKLLARIEREYSATVFSDTHEKISDAVEYIHDHFTDNALSVTHLAKMCNISETYFRKLFYDLFQTTPIVYIQNLKLNYAKELIQSGYYTIEEAARKCGFSTVNYFSSFIKKNTGFPPSHFQKKPL